MLAVDFKTHSLLDSAAIDRINTARAPYKRWLTAGVRSLDSALIDPALAAAPLDPDTLLRFQKRLGLSRDEREPVLRPLAHHQDDAKPEERVAGTEVTQSR